MSKRRTRKQKEKAKHAFQVSWEPSSSMPKRVKSEASVKRQLPKSSTKPGSKKKIYKFTKNTEQNTDLASIKKDISKSLIFTAIILASEIMLYLIWS